MTYALNALWLVSLGESALLAVGLAILTANSDWWCDAVVLVMALQLVPRSQRWCVAASSVLTWCSFPPLVWPTYWFTLTPCLVAWRFESARDVPFGAVQKLQFQAFWFRLILAAWSTGFVICWTTVAFLRHLPEPKSAVGLCIMLCGLYGALLIPVAATLRGLRTFKGGWITSCVGALLMAASREALARCLGIEWLAQVIALPAAATMLAQWSEYLGQAGVSGLILLMNLLLADIWQNPRHSAIPARFTLKKLSVPLFAWLIICAGGPLMYHRTVVVHPALRVALIQPHLPAASGDSLERTALLNLLTQHALSDAADTDLVVWPESSFDLRDVASDANWGPKALFHSVGEARPSFLIGVIRSRQDEHVIYDIPTVRWSSVNSAVLLTQHGGEQYHDKQKLLPLVEYVPDWMRTESMMRWLDGAILEPGVRTIPLQLTTRGNHPMGISVALCYEKFFGSLPQFHTGQSVIIHLTQNSWCRDHPLIPQLELWSCQYRAIETRAWQVQVASWQGSCVIDPRGSIRQSLGSTEGWLIFSRVQ